MEIETPQPLPLAERNQVFPYQRFFSKVDKLDVIRPGLTTPCWEWNSARHPKDNYGVFWMEGRSHQAHRVAWEYKYGKIPPGLILLHRCDNPPCAHVDPDGPPLADHFLLGTTAENNTDRNLKGHTKIHRGTHNGLSRLTSDHVREIRALCEGGELSYEQIANRFAVTASTVSRIKRGLTYKLVD